MGIKIVDNKKIDMTDDEWEIYKNICRSYDRPSFKGEELFRDLFETDNGGMIVFLKPPSNRYTSMEVFLFVSCVMQHQQLRLMNKKVDDLCESLRSKVDTLIESSSKK